MNSGDVAPFLHYLFTQLSTHWRCNQQPVRTVILADCLGLPLRTTQRYVSELERQGMVTRRTPKTGWLPA